MASTSYGVSHEIVELVPRRLYRLGGRVSCDGRVTWAPYNPGAVLPSSCYLAVDEDAAVLIDVGVARHGPDIVQQLDTLLAAGTPLDVFLTRMEADVVTALGSLLASRTVATVYAGGAQNPFDFFDDLNASGIIESGFQASLGRKKPGEAIPLSPDRELKVLTTPLRLLATYWLYDTGTRTLFTSDSFGYATTGGARSAPVVTMSNDAVTEDAVLEQLRGKFDYLFGAATHKIAEGLENLFNQLAIDRIAPSHGCVLEGPDVVERHCLMMLQRLRKMGC